MEEKWKIFLQKALKRPEKIVILGTGNALKADDAAGLLVASLLDNNLSRFQKSKIKILRAYEIIDIYLRKINRIKPSHLIIIDAIDLRKKPGTIVATRIDPKSKGKKKIAGEFYSFLDKLSAETSCKIFLIGIQPETLDFGHPITPAIKEACRQLADFFSQLFPRTAK